MIKVFVYLLADEKHTWLGKNRVYLPTTVAQGCFLGVSLTESASASALTTGYEEFQTEARCLDPDYAPVTVNTDAWDGTQQAWRNLFPTVTLVLCFLHAVLKVQKGSPTYRNLRKKLKTKLWKAYQATSAAEFLKRIRLALIWSKKHIRRKRTLQKLRKLCRRAAQLKVAYQFPMAHRTSNLLDRDLESPRPFIVYHAILSWFDGISEIISAFDGTDLEFPPLRD